MYAAIAIPTLEYGIDGDGIVSEAVEIEHGSGGMWSS